MSGFRSVIAILMFVSAGCATVSASPHLTPAEVIRLADAAAHRHSDRYNPRYFNRAEPNYSARFHAWRVNFNPKPGTGRREAFTIEVDDKTKEAGLILP